MWVLQTAAGLPGTDRVNLIATRDSMKNWVEGVLETFVMVQSLSMRFVVNTYLPPSIPHCRIETTLPE